VGYQSASTLKLIWSYDVCFVGTPCLTLFQGRVLGLISDAFLRMAMTKVPPFRRRRTRHSKFQTNGRAPPLRHYEYNPSFPAVGPRLFHLCQRNCFRCDLEFCGDDCVEDTLDCGKQSRQRDALVAAAHQYNGRRAQRNSGAVECPQRWRLPRGQSALALRPRMSSHGDNRCLRTFPPQVINYNVYAQRELIRRICAACQNVICLLRARKITSCAFIARSRTLPGYSVMADPPASGVPHTAPFLCGHFTR
jgi:hypothetical protein